MCLDVHLNYLVWFLVFDQCEMWSRKLRNILEICTFWKFWKPELSRNFRFIGAWNSAWNYPHVAEVAKFLASTEVLEMGKNTGPFIRQNGYMTFLQNFFTTELNRTASSLVISGVKRNCVWNLGFHCLALVRTSVWDQSVFSSTVKSLVSRLILEITRIQYSTWLVFVINTICCTDSSCSLAAFVGWSVSFSKFIWN